nr:UvrD-helicase domain-containing protein [Lachnospiraceae bacterium]
MGKIEFTKEQKKAIETRDKNILVSAAAGSGKTAILVERIIRRVTDKKDPVDIDRILVMTFTRAAAEQMREKILNAIEDKRKEDPFNTHLQKQEALIYTAHISTIHGFCLDVLKNHFNESGIDPDFRVADEGETKLLKADVMEEILEEAYEKGDENFITLSESVASGKNDKALEDTIMDVTKYSMSYPEPEEWLEKCVNTYESFATGDISNNKNLKWLHEEIRKKIEDIKRISESLIEFIRDSATLESYEPTIEADISMYAGLLEKTSYFDLITELQKIKYVTLGYDKNGKKVKCEIKPDKDEKTYVQETRKKCKDFLDKIINNINGYDEEKEKEHVKHTEPNVRTLCDLVRAFMDRYREKKEEAHILDYNDLEHLAIKVFKGNDGAIAAEYRDLFEEIYVDEYQDSNLVQEELINLISRKNNVFMVGDVKQSIYGFRLTRPEMFMEKYEKYQNDESSADTVIDLKHNFRSRPEVLDSVNEVFGSVMHKENADIEYDDKQKLIFGMKAYEELPSDNDRTELILINRDEEIGKTELEAEVIAERIKTLMREMKVFDSDDKNGRALRYSDIALLLRSTRGSGIYKRILEKNAIPVHVMNDEGYFEAKEVAILLDYLKIIDNPLQDIPLAAVLKSWFCKMRD